MKSTWLSLIVVLACGCTSMKVVPVDSTTGYFPARAKATVVSSKSIDLDQHKQLILVPNNDFLSGELKNIGYFDEVMTFDDMQKAIIQANLGEQIPSMAEMIGINNAAKRYKPFLWFHVKPRGQGTDQHIQFILTDATTLEDLLVAETTLDYMWSGVNDQNNWYPMMNALIDYIRANSKTYHTPK